jgi:hypothetical protein
MDLKKINNFENYIIFSYLKESYKMRRVPPPPTGKVRTSSSIGRPLLPKPPITQRAFT